MEASLEKFKSKEWRVNHLYKIVDKNSRLVTMKEFPFQKTIRTHPARLKQVLKYRQGGVTTGCSIDMLDDTIFKPNTTSMILAHKRQDLPKIFDKVRLAHREMDPRIRPVLDKGGGSRYELRFPEINSKIYTDIENRGDTIHRLHVSEAAFVEPAKLKATLGAVVPHGRICFESTPNGMGNEFYKHWANKRSPRAKLFFPWFIQPEYVADGSTVGNPTADELVLIHKAFRDYGVHITKDQLAWRRGMIAEFRDLFPQEFPEDDTTCFLASGGCPVDQEFVSKLMNEVPEPISNNGTLQVWEEFVDGHLYVLGCDVAEGVRSDYSVIDVFDCNTKTQVAQFRSNNIKPFKFGETIEQVAKLYYKAGRRWPVVAVELNNHGHAVNGYLEHTARYPNLYQYKKDTVGWHTNSITRPKMIDTFINGVEEEAFRINSMDTLGELLTLVDNGGKIEATDGEFDDTIISGAIAVQVMIEHGKTELYENLSSKILM